MDGKKLWIKNFWIILIYKKNYSIFSIYDLCFNPSGTQLIAAAGQHVLVYESNDGALIQLLKGISFIIFNIKFSY